MWHKWDKNYAQNNKQKKIKKNKNQSGVTQLPSNL